MPFGWFSTNVRAASCATASRLGWTSVEHIDPETSRARMIDVRAYGTLRSTCGRPAASASATRLGEQQGDGKVPLPPLPPRQHRAQERDARVANGLLAPAAQQSTSTPPRSAGTTSSDSSASGHANDISDHPPEPDDREERAEREEEPAGGGEERRHLAGLLDALELEVDRLVDLRERRGVARLVVRAVRDLGDLRQQVLVERRRDVEAVDLRRPSLPSCRLRSRGCGRRRSTRPRRASAGRGATCSPRRRAARSRTSRRSRCSPRRRRSRAPTRRSSAASRRSR